MDRHGSVESGAGMMQAAGLCLQLDLLLLLLVLLMMLSLRAFAILMGCLLSMLLLLMVRFGLCLRLLLPQLLKCWT